LLLPPQAARDAAASSIIDRFFMVPPHLDSY
jgi:hypothetical protein